MTHRSTLAWLASSATIALLLSGCSAGEADAGAEGVTYMDADGSCAAEPMDGIDFDSANEFMTSFQDPTSELPDLEPLAEPVGDDVTAVYLNNGTPVAALFQESLAEASEVAGIDLVNIDTGSDAQSINSALNSVVDMAPDIVFDQAVDATFFPDQLQALQDAGSIIVYGGQTNAADFDLVDSLGGLASTEVNSQVLGSSAIALTCGTATEFVFYSAPELPASQMQSEVAEETITDLCPDCTVRVVDISMTDPSPADAIVSDLQANPQTQFFMSMADQFQLGLQGKAELAGVTNAYGIGQSPLPSNIEQISTGLETAGYSVDFDLFMWLQVDEALRRLQGLDVPYLEDFVASGRMLSKVVTAVNVDAILAEDYVIVPGFQEQLTELWGR